MQSANIWLHAQVFISRYQNLCNRHKCSTGNSNGKGNNNAGCHNQSQTSNQNNKIEKRSPHFAILFCLCHVVVVVATATNYNCNWGGFCHREMLWQVGVEVLTVPILWPHSQQTGWKTAATTTTTTTNCDINNASSKSFSNTFCGSFSTSSLNFFLNSQFNCKCRTLKPTGVFSFRILIYCSKWIQYEYGSSDMCRFPLCKYPVSKKMDYWATI